MCADVSSMSVYCQGHGQLCVAGFASSYCYVRTATCVSQHTATGTCVSQHTATGTCVFGAGMENVAGERTARSMGRVCLTAEPIPAAGAYTWSALRCWAPKWTSAWSWPVCARDQTGQGLRPGMVSAVVFQIGTSPLSPYAPLGSHPPGGPGFPRPQTPALRSSPGCLVRSPLS